MIGFTQMRCKKVYFWVIFLLMTGIQILPFALAEDEPSPNEPLTDETPKAEVSSSPKSDAHPRNQKARTQREREAEGTQAPNRFSTDIILKSKYELNGQSLEVDPD